MIFRLITKQYAIVSNHEVIDNFEVGSNDFKFNIRLSTLATNVKLLNALGLISMYAESYQKQPATRANAVNFFKNYLDAFLSNKPALQETDNLCVLVVDKDIQSKIVEILVK